jgi:hypothetical protein
VVSLDYGVGISFDRFDLGSGDLIGDGFGVVFFKLRECEFLTGFDEIGIG